MSMKKLLFLSLFLFSFFVLCCLSLNSKADNADWYCLTPNDLTELEQKVMTEYAEQIIVSGTGVAMTACSLNTSIFLSQGRYLLIRDEYVSTFKIDNSVLSNAYYVAASSDFYIYIINVNTSKTYSFNVSATSSSNSWYPNVGNVLFVFTRTTTGTASIAYNQEYLKYHSVDGNKMFVCAMRLDDILNPPISDGIMSQISNSPSAYDNRTTISSNTSYNLTVTFDSFFPKSNIYIILRYKAGYLSPAVVPTTFFPTSGVKVVAQQLLTDNTYIIIYRIATLPFMLSGCPSISETFRIINEGYPTSTIAICSYNVNIGNNSLIYKFSSLRDNKFYYVWGAEILQYANLTIGLFDTNDNPIQNVVVQVLQANLYNRTDTRGYTKFSYLIVGFDYDIIVAWQGNAYYFKTKPLSQGENVRIYQLASYVYDTYSYLTFNYTVFKTQEYQYNRWRYYYFLDNLNWTYYFTIYSIDQNKYIFNKTLTVNTGYIDYFFDDAGTYIVNISYPNGAIKHSNQITILPSTIFSKIYPRFSPFAQFEQMKFIIINNDVSNTLYANINNEITEIPPSSSTEKTVEISNMGVYNASLYLDINMTLPIAITKFAVYDNQYFARLDAETSGWFRYKIKWQHNFIGEGNTYLRVSDTADMGNILWKKEISNATHGYEYITLPGNKTYWIDIQVLNVSIAKIYVRGLGGGGEVGGEATGITQDLFSNIAVGFGLPLSFFLTLIGLIIIIAIALLFGFYVKTSSAVIVGSLIGAVISCLFGFLPFWILILFGLFAIALILIGIKRGGEE